MLTVRNLSVLEHIKVGVAGHAVLAEVIPLALQPGLRPRLIELLRWGHGLVARSRTQPGLRSGRPAELLGEFGGHVGAAVVGGEDGAHRRMIKSAYSLRVPHPHGLPHAARENTARAVLFVDRHPRVPCGRATVRAAATAAGGCLASVPSLARAPFCRRASSSGCAFRAARASRAARRRGGCAGACGGDGARGDRGARVVQVHVLGSRRSAARGAGPARRSPDRGGRRGGARARSGLGGSSRGVVRQAAKAVRLRSCVCQPIAG
mmetsp:Transcript_46540/g.145768  ORF Transcript_46540/g.145768 Transcript_46540/m.145768 type:complete len:264 (-) Transcript_46540:225-1016(-)